MSSHDPLGEALRDRADRLGDTSPLSLDDVKGRARGIRRRRMAVSGLAAAAVLAVAVPAGIAVSDQATSRPDRGPAASPSGTPTDEETPTPGPSPEGPHHVTLTTDVDAGISYEPGIPYLYDGAIVRPGGSEVPVEVDYAGLAPLGDGWVATRRDDEGNAFVDFLDADGTVTGSNASTGSLAVSADGTVVSYATPDGQLMIVTPDAAPMPLVDPEALPGGILDPVAVIGSDSCVENAADGGCTVFVNSQDAEKQAAYSVTSRGAGSPLVLSAHGLSPDGSLSGVVSIDNVQGGSCSVVLTPAGEDLWKTCDYTLGQFSQDGRYVIGHPAQLDGFGDSSVAILDARTGDLLAEAMNSAEHQASVYDVVWDEDGSLLMTVSEEGTWSLMRMTVTGELTAVAPDIGDNADEVPVVLPTRP
jgi:hypothetical protein